MTINSAMALSEELLQNNFHTVLTCKMNQGPIERFFGIARSIDNTPTEHSWLHIFRILSMHNLTKTAVKNGKVDNEDELKVLVGYKKCLNNVSSIDVTNDELIYNICGYLLHSRSEVLECCKCKSLLKTEESELPETFAPANYTLSRSYGYLKLASIQMFECFKKVDSKVDNHFSNDDHIYIRDAFEQLTQNQSLSQNPSSSKFLGQSLMHIVWQHPS
uniref:Uncharacterized protein n=1 Tax=Daphnia galeata TaxID=27404 RepID=A0A8J2WJ61_9CRUS|nr:unnamed protein product [Daphnia galeata]